MFNVSKLAEEVVLSLERTWKINKE
jgi:hypothetical protein